jgi:hypothetical protein
VDETGIAGVVATTLLITRFAMAVISIRAGTVKLANLREFRLAVANHQILPLSSDRLQPHLRRDLAVPDAECARVLGIPGRLFTMAVNADGVITAKQPVNTLAQLTDMATSAWSRDGAP